MAKLATLITKLDDVPEALREFYTPVSETDTEAGYTLSLDQSGSRSRVDEFRNNNIDLRKQVEGLEAKLGTLGGLEARLKGMDDFLAKQKDDEDRAADKAALDSGNIEDVVERRVNSALRDAETRSVTMAAELKAAEGERDQFRRRADSTTVRDAISGAMDAAKVRILPGAMVDIMARAGQTWSVDHDNEGRLVAKDGHGDTIYGKGGQPLTVGEYAGKLAQEAPHFFESGRGAESLGSRARHLDTGGKPRVDMSDPTAIGRNLDDLIAKKSVLVPRAE